MDKNGVSPAIVAVVVILVVVAGVGVYFVIRGRGGETTWVDGLPMYPGAQQAEEEVTSALTTLVAGSLPTERSIYVYQTSADVDTVAAWYGPQMSAVGWGQTGDVPLEVAEYQVSGRVLAYDKGNDRAVIMVATNPTYGHLIVIVKWQAPAELELPSGPELEPVVASGTHFEVENRPFHFFGAFTFEELSHLIYAPSYYAPWVYEPWKENYQGVIDKYLASLTANDIHMIRFFAFGPYEARMSGRSEPDWEKLDYLVKRCENAGIRIIWVLWDRWDYGGGGAVMEDYDYTTDNRVLPSIVHSLQLWKDSPAIFAWEIMNEGDCLTWTPEKMTKFEKWFADVSSHMKTIDNVHLISTGFSGDAVADWHFVGDEAGEQAFADFLTRIYENWSIDYISSHVYGGNPDLLLSPENYDNRWFERVDWSLDWIDNYRTTMNKPVILEEFGAARQIGESLRTQIYNYVIQKCIQKKIDATFNGWGAGESSNGVLIFNDDVSLAALIRATVATFNSMT